MRAPKVTFKRARELRRKMTLPEVLLWQALRKGRLAGLRFRRQHPMGPYILDFYCPSARLAVEVDGASHDIADQVQYDTRREEWLAKGGINILRVSARDVLREETLEGILVAIEQAAAPSTACGGPPPPPSGGGT
ncbi:MAG: hypothetical protein NVS2B5_29120 [Beijerinckiaceae bacterium]